MDHEMIGILLKFLGMMLGIMTVVFLTAVVTPKIAKLFGKKEQQKDSPERVEDSLSPEEFEVKGPYDKNNLEDFDPNYKIYNTDIYGSESLDRLKKRKSSSSGKN